MERATLCEDVSAAHFEGATWHVMGYLQIFLEGQDSQLLVLRVEEGLRKPPDLRDEITQTVSLTGGVVP